MQRVLEGVRVLDLSRYIAGPMCGAIMADLGAEVIRVEMPSGAEDRDQGPLPANDMNLRYQMVSRNKKGITLDLDKPKGKELFRRLVEKSDVLIENYSPPVKEKLGLTYEALKAIKPDIILATVSAFGTTGPDRRRLGFDHIIQAESGAMSIAAFPDSPELRAQVAWVDCSTATNTALGVAYALMHRNKTGEGQWVETALLDTAVSYLGFQGIAAEYQVLGMLRPKLGNAGYYSFSDTFAARDGTVMIALVSEPLWKRLATMLGRPELCDDPRFVGDTARYQNRHVINALLDEWVGQRTTAEVLAAMGEARIPCGRVGDVGEMTQNAQVAARGLFESIEVPELGRIPHPRMAIRLSATPGQIETPAPRVGEHNEEVYRDVLGISGAEFAALQAEGIL